MKGKRRKGVFDRLGRTHAHGSEQGATLPELLIAMVISASVIGLIGTALFQLFVASTTGNARLSALHNIQTAALWLNRDVQEAESFSAGAGPEYGTFATGDSSIQYRYSYHAGAEALVREVLIDGTPDLILRVARGIQEQGDVAFTENGGLVTITMTVTPEDGGMTESGRIDVAMRVH
jgi:hypothetical protein